MGNGRRCGRWSWDGDNGICRRTETTPRGQGDERRMMFFLLVLATGPIFSAPNQLPCKSIHPDWPKISLPQPQPVIKDVLTGFSDCKVLYFLQNRRHHSVNQGQSSRGKSIFKFKVKRQLISQRFCVTESLVGNKLFLRKLKFNGGIAKE
jgi:hypothetical protein